jgi:hypothetical protein
MAGVNDKVGCAQQPGSRALVLGQMRKPPFAGFVRGFYPGAQRCLIRIKNDVEDLLPGGVQGVGNLLKVILDQDSLRGDQVLAGIPGQLNLNRSSVLKPGY